MKKYTFFLGVLMFFFLIELNSQTTGSALQFDGTDDYMDCGNPNFNLTNQITVMAWIKWTIVPSSGNNFSTLISNNSNQSQNNAQFWLQQEIIPFKRLQV